MTWAWLALVIGVTFVAVVLGGRVPRRLWTMVAAALVLGLVGYMLAGRPGQGGSPVAAADENDGFGERLGTESGALADRFGPAGRWIALSDSFARRGRTEDAAHALEAGLKAYPGNADLWVAYGTSLLAHAGGAMTPAAELAFEEAQRRDPAHPGPRFFGGLGLAQAGDLAGAERTWAELLADTPADAPWRGDVEQRLALVRAVIARRNGAQPGGGRPAPPLAIPDSGQP